MFKPDFLQKLTAQLSEILPKHAETLKHDFEKNCHTLLNHTFNKLDLVTRQEFDIQTKVLARTREQLETLKKEVARLEAELTARSHPHEEN